MNGDRFLYELRNIAGNLNGLSVVPAIQAEIFHLLHSVSNAIEIELMGERQKLISGDLDVYKVIRTIAKDPTLDFKVNVSNDPENKKKIESLLYSLKLDDLRRSMIGQEPLDTKVVHYNEGEYRVWELTTDLRQSSWLSFNQHLMSLVSDVGVVSSDHMEIDLVLEYYQMHFSHNEIEIVSSLGNESGRDLCEEFTKFLAGRAHVDFDYIEDKLKYIRIERDIPLKHGGGHVRLYPSASRWFRSSNSSAYNVDLVGCNEEYKTLTWDYIHRHLKAEMFEELLNRMDEVVMKGDADENASDS